MSHFEGQGDPVVGAAATDEVWVGLPAPVATYTRATNLSNFDTFSSTFAEDVLVNDQLTDYRGMERSRPRAPATSSAIDCRPGWISLFGIAGTQS